LAAVEFEIPRSHPRYHSLVAREKLVEAFKEGIVVPQGLIAHGRGECFDYLLGERSHEFAVEAARAAAAWFLLARHPVISVNGNYAALAAEEIRELQEVTGAPVEVNIFYRTEERVRRIEEHLRAAGVSRVLGSECEKTRVPGLESPRGIVCREGIASADFVLLAMEDGDRTEALVRWGKTVAAIDLNPFSRTAQKASITIVDEAVRATRLIVREVEKLKGAPRRELEEIVRSYDNRRVLSEAFKAILERLRAAAERGVL
jgi:4-phosphopantoate--beta-alanine ligase